jgi:hypothetical protein
MTSILRTAPFILNYVFRDQRIIKWTISKRFQVEEKDKIKTLRR